MCTPSGLLDAVTVKSNFKTLPQKYTQNILIQKLYKKNVRISQTMPLLSLTDERRNIKINASSTNCNKLIAYI